MSNTLTIEQPLKVVERIRGGIPVEVLGKLAQRLGLSEVKLAQFLGLNTRTLSRKRSAGKGAALSVSYSERVVRLERLLAMAETVFASLEDARGWLESPCVALGGEVPLALLDTDIGSQEVERVLLAIEWGITL